MPSETDPRQLQVTATLMVLARAYRGAVDRVLNDLGLSHSSAWTILQTGHLGDGIRQGALAEALGIEAPSLVRIIDQLVEAGLMRRVEDATDRRVRTVHLTSEGRAVLRQIDDLLTQWRNTLFADIAGEDLDACLRVFDGLNKGLGKHFTVRGRDL